MFQLIKQFFFNDLIESNYFIENKNILYLMVHYFEDTWIKRLNYGNSRRPVIFINVNMQNCYNLMIQDLVRTNNSV